MCTRGRTDRTLSTYISLPYSRGTVRLASSDPVPRRRSISIGWRMRGTEPFVERSCAWANVQCRAGDRYALTRFHPASPSGLQRSAGDGAECCADQCCCDALDSGAPVRKFLIGSVISEAAALAGLLADRGQQKSMFVLRCAVPGPSGTAGWSGGYPAGSFHPSGSDRTRNFMCGCSIMRG